MIQTRSDLYKSDGINFVDAARFRVVAYRGRVARDGQEVAYSSDAPGAKERGLQTDEILIARGHVWNGLDAARLQSPGEHQCVHAYAGQRAAIDVNGIDAAARRNLIHLLEDALERNAFGGIDLHGHRKFACFELAP